MKRFALLFALLSILALACGITAPLPTLQKTGQAVNIAALATQKPANTPESTDTCYGLVNVGNLNLRAFPDPESKPDGAGLIDGDIVRIIGTVGTWYKIETKDGRQGYAKADYISRPGCVK